MRERRNVPAMLAALSIGASLAVVAGPAPAAGADTGWTVKPVPFTFGSSDLQTVTAAGPDAVLAGGAQAKWRQEPWCGLGICQSTDHHNPVLQKWNGSGWSWISTPGMTGKGQIHHVDAVTAANVWAGGGYDNGLPYFARLDAGVWQNVAPPAQLGTVRTLDADAAGAWAAGEPRSVSGGPSLFRWVDGTWTPQDLGSASINTVRQRVAGDVWAVGETGANEGYAARYDGTSWSTVTPPQMARGELHSVLPLADDDVWVTGSVWRNGVDLAVSYHWDGSTWREDALPAGTSFGERTGAAAITDDGAGGVWAVAHYSDKVDGGPGILHYTGGAWRLEATAPGSSSILGLARVPGTSTLWAVGAVGAGINTEILILTKG
ncbi:hypothetical protein [Actinomadura sp. 9N407]|uniref:hypothetical protein n=1 Tax=Actinomadura sp. 9N407 TaxID=3375154 RepID=UPI00379FC0BB